MSRPTDERSGLSPTERVLCACARRVGDSAAVAGILAAPPDAVDWQAIPELLVRHGLIVLAASHLTVARDAIPDAVWRRIQAAAFLARATSLAMCADLMHVLHACTASRVDVLPFKGPLLGLDAYDDLGARPFVDLDLLVRPDDLKAAVVVLEALGYRSQYLFSPARERWFRRVDGDYPMVHADTGRLVELHVRAMSRRFGSGLDTSDLWRRRRTVTVSGESVAVLGLDDLLYLNLLHGAKHRWERLEWLASAGELLRARGGDAAALLRPPYAGTRAVLVGCALARDLVGAPLDPATTSAIAGDAETGRIARIARDHLFAASTNDDDTAAKLWFNFRVQRGLMARARYSYRWLVWPSPEDWASVGIPDVAFFLYRLARPLRLLWRYARPVRDHGHAHG